jgi:hypothetical protein
MRRKKKNKKRTGRAPADLHPPLNKTKVAKAVGGRLKPGLAKRRALFPEGRGLGVGGRKSKRERVREKEKEKEKEKVWM